MRKFSFEEVRDFFEGRGYELLETQYINSKVKMSYRCPYHLDKEINIALDKLKRGRGCPYCGRERTTNSQKPNFKEVRFEFEKRSYKLLETEYHNIMTKMRYKCPHHPDKETSICLNSLKQGAGCPHCYNERRSEVAKGKKCYNWQGGVASLNTHLRDRMRDWKIKSLANFDYKCALTKDKKDLQIHHAKSFYKIRDEALKELGLDKRENRNNYTEEEIRLILEQIEKRHNNILGIPLRKDIHKLFHALYSRRNNTLEQFYEFKGRWESGEFNEVKNDNKSQQEQLSLLI